MYMRGQPPAKKDESNTESSPGSPEPSSPPSAAQSSNPPLGQPSPSSSTAQVMGAIPSDQEHKQINEPEAKNPAQPQQGVGSNISSIFGGMMRPPPLQEGNPDLSANAAGLPRDEWEAQHGPQTHLASNPGGQEQKEEQASDEEETKHVSRRPGGSSGAE